MPAPGTQNPTPLAVALHGLCPRCGARTLFAGIIRCAPACRVCGLDIAAFNVGDGPAAFLVLIVGAIVTGLAITLQISADPPWWVHVLIWPVVTVTLVLVLLRLAKGLLIALEYKNAAREGWIVDSDG